MQQKNVSQKNPFMMLVIDINPIIWGAYGNKDTKDIAPKIPFLQAFEHLITFISSYLIMSEGSICILACSPRSSTFIPITTQKKCVISDIPTIRKQLLQLVEYEMKESKKQPKAFFSVSQGLSTAMCYLHKKEKIHEPHSKRDLSSENVKPIASGKEEQPQNTIYPRILVVWATPLCTDSNSAVMNVAFSAKRMGIAIDCMSCMNDKSSTEDSNDHSVMKELSHLSSTQLLLQLCSSLSSGVFIPLQNGLTSDEESQAEETSPQMFQQLILNFLPFYSSYSPTTPSTDPCHLPLRIPISSTIDSAPSSALSLSVCVCHHKQTSIGFLCSRCFSVFCTQVDKCSVCSAEYHAIPMFSSFVSDSLKAADKEKRIIENKAIASDFQEDEEISYPP
ncbi:General transcription factor IIH subunit 3 [Monocercomonoides exilis]|uniref:General transcription factor IIH subunit 3 n=1 Tax=Monocercomonoides exilis TaxID=2049356 RepID=UPI003559CF71|nr:General transcription factor IIH subunit 3 [Monocercomonoides exilis]|eukprot:MONOS_2766.1-p1 / transcript=MONOS_2766.1 / gene=MONOS_2766 / organism=Monocercomonoides_exilis_PA203 / gene_product=General transcription factor IIH subunit 3 / transcript_product=General transcription factor IIH subunit 3 / location=Mono_scaffold00059:44284-45711(+) / protein_length=392 / sequence_SO=supercontig / SO=protein_coding / is_pseudo=false